MSSTPPQRNLPAVGLNPHHVRVFRRLYEAAQQSAETAIQHHASEDEHKQLLAAVAVGATAEYLARAALAFHDPLLLAKAGSVESQIMLSRANHADPLDPAVLRSLEIASVWSLLQKLNPRLTPYTGKGGQKPAPVELVMTVRNAAAHMALVDVVQLEAAARALVAIVEALHPIGSRGEGDFWPASLAASVQLLKTASTTAAARRAQVKIDVARQYHRTLLEGFATADRERTQVLLESRDVGLVTLERSRNVPTPCPACGRLGVISYLIEEGEPEHGGYGETPGGSYIDHGWARELSFAAALFQCPVCNLTLNPDEFNGADLSATLDFETEDIDDPYADWEPDEDYVRGR